MLHTDCGKPELMSSAYCTIARSFYSFFALSLFSTFFTELNLHDQSENYVIRWRIWWRYEGRTDGDISQKREWPRGLKRWYSKSGRERWSGKQTGWVGGPTQGWMGERKKTIGMSLQLPSWAAAISNIRERGGLVKERRAGPGQSGLQWIWGLCDHLDHDTNIQKCRTVPGEKDEGGDFKCRCVANAARKGWDHKRNRSKAEEDGPGEKSRELQCLNRRNHKRQSLFTRPGREHRTGFKESKGDFERDSMNSTKVNDKNTAKWNEYLASVR